MTAESCRWTTWHESYSGRHDACPRVVPMWVHWTGEDIAYGGTAEFAQDEGARGACGAIERVATGAKGRFESMETMGG